MEWEAYQRLEPFGEERADLRAGVIAAVIAEVNRDRKKRKKPYRADDFFPNLSQEETDGMSLLNKARAFNAALGGEDRTR